MRLFPYLNTVYSSPLEQGELLRRVQNVTEPPAQLFELKWPFASKPEHAYRGEVDINRGDFEVQRVIWYRNSFLPVIRGEIWIPGGVADLGTGRKGTAVRLTMRINLGVLIFMGLWLSGVGFGCLMILLSSPGWLGIVPFLMLGFGLLLLTVPFWREATKSETFFKELLQLTEVPEAN